MRFLKSVWQAGASQFKFFLVVLLGYLFQVCVMPYLRIGDVTPSILFAITAIVTIGYGRLRAVWAGCIYGILMETMCPTIRMLNLLLYPLTAGFMSMFFSDKSEKRLEYERSLGKAGRNVNPYLRTIGCAAGSILIYEIVNLLYIYLGGAVLSGSIIGRALSSILWTTVFTAIIMIPVRRFLGFKKLKKDKPPEKPHFQIGRA
ncbi:MAG: hypothetical protein E7316_02215 [Clostridiales bacterium]|nr:hypothetical protein [Clostridiales bacterium]